MGAAVAAVVEVAVFFFPEDDEDPDFFDLSGVFLERERVGRAADICKVEVLLVVVAELQPAIWSSACPRNIST